MNIKAWLFSMVAVTFALFYSHSIGFDAGVDSAVVAVQAESLDNVEVAAKNIEKINKKDANRYSALDKNNRILQSKYDKLLVRSREKVIPGENSEKYDICTYDSNTIKLLIDSASGGGNTGNSTGIGIRPDNTVSKSCHSCNRNTAGVNREIDKERQAVLAEFVLPFEPDKCGKRQKSATA